MEFGLKHLAGVFAAAASAVGANRYLQEYVPAAVESAKKIPLFGYVVSAATQAAGGALRATAEAVETVAEYVGGSPYQFVANKLENLTAEGATHAAAVVAVAVIAAVAVHKFFSQPQKN